MEEEDCRVFVAGPTTLISASGIAAARSMPPALGTLTQGRRADDAETIAFGEIFDGYDWGGHEVMGWGEED